MVSVSDLTAHTRTHHSHKKQHDPPGKNILADLRSVWPCFEPAIPLHFTQTLPCAKTVPATQLCGPNTGNRLLLMSHRCKMEATVDAEKCPPFHAGQMNDSEIKHLSLFICGKRPLWNSS